MATLTRPKPDATQQSELDSMDSTTAEAAVAANIDLSSTVPTPFPQLRRIRANSASSQRIQNAASNATTSQTGAEFQESKDQIASVVQSEDSHTEQTSVLPSISHVENSCLITLNTLLSGSRPQFQWMPILPNRRHSMPSSSNIYPAESESNTTSALETLLSNLRSLAGEEQGMIQVNSDTAGGRQASMNELQSRVDSIANSLDSSDAQLARSLVSLLVHAERLSQLQPDSLHIPEDSSTAPWDTYTYSIYDTLDRQVSHLKARRNEEEGAVGVDGEAEPRATIERALLWNRIDQDLEVVSRLCRERMDPFRDDAQVAQRAISPSLPPEYDPADFELPEYRMSYEHPPSFTDEKEKKKLAKLGITTDSVQARPSTASAHDEKMRLDFEAITMAIDRLYLVAPQLHNQRVELKKKKLEEMERAAKSTSKPRVRGTSTTGSGADLAMGERGDLSRQGSGSKTKGKQRAEVEDLESMLSLIGKASSRRMNDQAVVLSDEMKWRFQKAKQQDDEKRQKFVEQLASHSDAGRLHDQDATLNVGPRVKDPEALLTLPEFIREAIPSTQTRLNDPNALLTLPEFVRESQKLNGSSLNGEVSANEANGNEIKSGHSSDSKSKKTLKNGRTTRSKSFTSASVAGLLGKSWSRTVAPNLPTIPSPTEASKPNSSQQAGLSIAFVAEHQSNLNAVVILFKVNGVNSPPKQLTIEVVPTAGDTASGDRLLIRRGASYSQPLPLPVPVELGKSVINPVGEHYELKLNTATSTDQNEYTSATLDATQLLKLDPSSFVCSSCSLPLVQPTVASPADLLGDTEESKSDGKDGSGKDLETNTVKFQYRDLPSEFWAELVDAWMCHHDQKLTEQFARNAKEGSWPKTGECLVGGSYLLLEESSIVKSNLRQTEEPARDDDWKYVRCLCGALVGRSQVSPITHKMTYRLPKYSIRPVTTNMRTIRIPLSAYVVEDMIELSQAHAAYRFIVCDEEEEKPRLLLWLFKPNMRLSYSTATYSLIPRSGSIVAAKTLFKIIGPGGTLAYDMKTTLEKHPNFAQAEQLFYPLDICRRLAALLRESHSTYPSNRRTMSGLDAGWLQRS